MSSHNASAPDRRDVRSGRRTTVGSPNPRRTPPREMKVLGDGKKRQKLSHSPEQVSLQQEHAAIADAKNRVLKSQESGSSDQSASRWFDDANKNVPHGTRAQTELDNDPPFYMSDHVNYNPANFVASDSDRIFGGQQSRFDSENEDLRGVIDDLTIENKRLRHILRSQSQSKRGIPNDAAQQQDKLFEVRMHGLPPEKRRELEYLLKNFATSVHTSVPSKPTSRSDTTRTSSSGQGASAIKASKTTDSGYASQSNSGNSSTLNTGLSVPKSTSHKNVHNYLLDIPDTLMPKRNPVISEPVKMALVVRRLEQLFTGRSAAGDHDQPKQQQEVSDSAARADRILDGKSNKRKRAEGSREAQVMPPDSRINLDVIDHSGVKDNSSSNKLRKDCSIVVDGNAVTRPASPEQRPTRPLDLDIHRAQVAADNIQYISHLGLSSPSGSFVSSTQEGPWLYLNLLMSMAQLHTINVTPDFVRKALKKLSKRFELSKDGYKVRWIGGAESTRFLPEDEKFLETVEVSPRDLLEDVDTGNTCSKRSNSNSTSNAAITTSEEKTTSGLQTSSGSKLLTTDSGNWKQQSVSLTNTKPTTTSSAFDYKPIVYREKVRNDFDDSYLRDSDDSFDSTSGDSSGLVHALSKSNLNQKSKEEGLITFYNNPFFCSDYSSDSTPSNMKASRIAIPGETLGVHIPSYLGAESPLRHHDATYYATQFAPEPYQPSSDNDPKLNLDTPDLTRALPFPVAGESETVPKEFEVAGLGGITPDDNFAIDTTLHMVRAPRSGPGVIVHQLPFSRRKYLQHYKYKNATAHKLDLLPSKLPPPSYIFFTNSSSEEDLDIFNDSSSDSGSDADDSEGSSSPLVDEQFPAPPTFLMQFSGSSKDNSPGNNNPSHKMDTSESGSIDMLAIARRVDPTRIAEQERLYLVSQPGGGMGFRAVAGSLAATVGASQSSSSEHEFDAADGNSSIDVEDDKHDRSSESENESDESVMEMNV